MNEQCTHIELVMANPALDESRKKASYEKKQPNPRVHLFLSLLFKSHLITLVIFSLVFDFYLSKLVANV